MDDLLCLAEPGYCIRCGGELDDIDKQNDLSVHANTHMCVHHLLKERRQQAAEIARLQKLTDGLGETIGMYHILIDRLVEQNDDRLSHADILEMTTAILREIREAKQPSGG